MDNPTLLQALDELHNWLVKHQDIKMPLYIQNIQFHCIINLFA